MNKGLMMLLVGLVSLLMLTIPIGSGCSPAAAPKEKFVQYLDLSDLTGLCATEEMPASRGLEDYLRYVNDTKGGVDGVQLKVITVDTRYDTARAISAYRRYKSEPKVLIVKEVSTACNKALLPSLEADHLVGNATPDGEQEVLLSRNFIWTTSYQDQFTGILEFCMNDWKAKGKTGTPVVAGLHWDNQAGREAARGSLEYAQQWEAQGLIKVLPPQYFPISSPEVTSYLATIAAQNPDYLTVMTGPDPSGTLVARDAYSMGLQNKMTIVQAMYGPDEMVGIKSNPEATEGNYVLTPTIAGDEFRNNPIISELIKKYRGGEEQMRPYARGVLWGIEFEEGVRLALNKVGYEALNGDALYDAYQNLTGISYQGIAGPAGAGFLFSKTRRAPSDYSRVYQVRNGKLVAVGDWVECPYTSPLYYNK